MSHLKRLDAVAATPLLGVHATKQALLEALALALLLVLLQKPVTPRLLLALSLDVEIDLGISALPWLLILHPVNNPQLVDVIPPIRVADLVSIPNLLLFQSSVRVLVFKRRCFEHTTKRRC
jgi:DNA polymerase III epsilon subunit-like protein